MINCQNIPYIDAQVLGMRHSIADAFLGLTSWRCKENCLKIAFARPNMLKIHMKLVYQ